MKKYILSKEYPELHPDDVTVTLIEAGSQLLGSMKKKSQMRALRDLKSLMVNVRLDTALKSYEQKYVTFTDGHKAHSANIGETDSSSYVNDCILIKNNIDSVAF